MKNLGNFILDLDFVRLVREGDRAFWVMACFVVAIIIVLALVANVVMSRTDHYAAQVAGRVIQCTKHSNGFLLSLIGLSFALAISSLVSLGSAVSYMNWRRYRKGCAASRHMSSSTRDLFGWTAATLLIAVVLTIVVVVC